jgi:ADP-ribose pyrophosphatase
MDWKILTSTYISQHPYFTARVDKCEMPNGKIVENYYVVELPTTVCALAITKDGNAIMIKQYRHPIQQVLLEIPGGFIDTGETPEEAIKRELLEETGYVFENIYKVGKIAANPGVLTGFTYLFLATAGERVGGQQLDSQEEIAIHLMPVEAVRTLFNNNEIVQALHTTCMLYAFKKWDELNSKI